MPSLNWRSLALAAAYVVAGYLFIRAILQLTPAGPVSDAILFTGIGLVVLLLAQQFLSGAGERWPGGMLLLLTAWAAAGAALLYGISQVTPAGPSRQFVIFAGTGAIIAALSWRFLSVRPLALRGETDDKESQSERDTRITRDLLLAFSYVGACGLLFYSIHAVVPAGPVDDLFRYIGAGILIAAASLLSGALLGFLFGIPRAQASQPDTAHPPAAGAAAAGAAAPGAAPRAGFQVNTNLEQISDWLTKIIVGLGLINLEKFPKYLQDLAAYFGASFGDKVPGRESVALALIILFFVCGFLLGYLLTRLFLTGALARAESPQDEVQRIVKAAGEAPLAPAAGGAARPQSVDPGQIAAAQRVAEVATEVDVSQLQRQIYTLAQEYNVRRSTMPFSPERTRLLDGVVAKMRVLHGPTYSLLPQLAKGGTAGERLAALAFLQMRPNPDYLGWLADRFGTSSSPAEQPFLMYHAAVALRTAAETLAPQYREATRSAVKTALERVPQQEVDTLHILQAAEAAVHDNVNGGTGGGN